MNLLSFSKPNAAFDKRIRWAVKLTSGIPPVLKRNLTCRLPHSTHKRQDHRDEGHNRQQRESGAITQKVGRTIHWETRDTRGKEGVTLLQSMVPTF